MLHPLHETPFPLRLAHIPRCLRAVLHAVISTTVLMNGLSRLLSSALYCGRGGGGGGGGTVRVCLKYSGRHIMIALFRFVLRRGGGGGGGGGRSGVFEVQLTSYHDWSLPLCTARRGREGGSLGVFEEQLTSYHDCSLTFCTTGGQFVCVRSTADFIIIMIAVIRSVPQADSSGVF